MNLLLLRSRAAWLLVPLAAFTIASAGWGGQVSGTSPSAPPQASAYSLAFSDDFDSLDLSSDRAGAHTWYEGVWFNQHRAARANISAWDSLLSLTWRADQDSRDTSISTFSTAGWTHHAWRYGYFEARMKWNVVHGAWPAFWLIPVEDAERTSIKNGRRESGEIDIFEGQGDEPHTYYGTIHDWIDLRSTANPNNHFPLPESVDLSQFHVYGMLWTPGKISWYFDNRLLHSEATPAILDRENFFVVLGMQEGVNWKIGDESGVQSRQMALYVDWVRVWQK